MDLEHFRALHPPNIKPSQLKPHAEAIFRLRQEGYTYAQIREWLVTNGVEVSFQAVHKFVQRQLKTEPSQRTARDLQAVSREGVGKDAGRRHPISCASSGSIPSRAAQLQAFSDSSDAQPSAMTPDDSFQTAKARAERTASRYLGGHTLESSIDALLQPTSSQT